MASAAANRSGPFIRPTTGRRVAKRSAETNRSPPTEFYRVFFFVFFFAFFFLSVVVLFVVNFFSFLFFFLLIFFATLGRVSLNFDRFVELFFLKKKTNLLPIVDPGKATFTFTGFLLGFTGFC